MVIACPTPDTACGACNYLQHGATLAVSGSVTYIFSPTLVIDGTSASPGPSSTSCPPKPTNKYALDELGTPGTNLGNLPWAGGIPQFQMSNFTTMGESYPPLEYSDPIFEYLANATKTKATTLSASARISAASTSTTSRLTTASSPSPDQRPPSTAVLARTNTTRSPTSSWACPPAKPPVSRSSSPSIPSAPGILPFMPAISGRWTTS